MRNCVVELLGLDFESSYQMAFVYVRQVCLMKKNLKIFVKFENNWLKLIWNIARNSFTFGIDVEINNVEKKRVKLAVNLFIVEN